jgi:hypothetical protein
MIRTADHLDRRLDGEAGRRIRTNWGCPNGRADSSKYPPAKPGRAGGSPDDIRRVRLPALHMRISCAWHQGKTTVADGRVRAESCPLAYWPVRLLLGDKRASWPRGRGRLIYAVYPEQEAVLTSPILISSSTTAQHRVLSDGVDKAASVALAKRSSDYGRPQGR